MIEYKGYVAHIELDEDLELFHGEVINTKDVITFKGESIAELKKELKCSVDLYLDFCAKHGKEPDKPLSGKFTLRMPPDLHHRAFLAAKRARKSLNAWVIEQLEHAAT
jgi:predicted HicB family RNase H-like nuclease